MKIIMIIVLCLALIILISLGISGCKVTSPETTTGTTEEVKTTEAKATGTETTIPELKIGMPADQGTNDPFKNHGAEGLFMNMLVYSGLTNLDKDYKVVPGVAQSWEVSADGTVYTFHLVQGIKFHNGRELTADDVKWTYEKYIDPNTAYVYSSDFDRITNIEVVDKYTLKITLKEPYSPFVAGIATGIRPILAQEAFEEVDGVLQMVQPIGSGPYKVIEWKPDNYYALEAFDDYYGGTPNVEKITFQIIPDDTVRLTALKTGELNIIRNVSPVDLAAYLENPSSTEYILTVAPGTETLASDIAFNHTKGPFTDLALRQAVMSAIDLDAINKTVNQDTCEISYGIYPPENFWASPVKYPSVDLEKAKELVSDAGYPDGLTVELMTGNAYNWEKVATVVQAQLDQIGIKVNISVLDIAKFFDQEQVLGGAWDMKIGGTILWADPSMQWMTTLRTNSPANWWFGGYNNAQIDELLDESVTISDVNERKNLYDQVYQKLYDDAAIVFLYTTPFNFGYRSDIEGIEFNTSGDLIFDTNKGIPWVTKKAE